MLEKQKKNDKFKLAILILAILLAISSVSLAGMLVYKHVAPSASASVTVPDNIIVSDTESDTSPDTTEWMTNTPSGAATNATAHTATGATTNTASNQTSNKTSNTSANVNTNASANATTNTSANANTNASASTNRIATELSLHKKAAEDNVPFQAVNMFPGDAEAQYFCVHVSYKEGVTVRFTADIRSGYEKLAEVLKCKVVLLSTGETLYDGLMKDMPVSLDHYLYHAEGTTSELYYEITAYLDTSVGNEYQNKVLVTDLHWWVDVEEEEHLIEAPKTGDEANVLLWAGLWGTSLCMLLLLWMKKKKEVQHEAK